MDNFLQIGSSMQVLLDNMWPSLILFRKFNKSHQKIHTDWYFASFLFLEWSNHQDMVVCLHQFPAHNLIVPIATWIKSQVWIINRLSPRTCRCPGGIQIMMRRTLCRSCPNSIACHMLKASFLSMNYMEIVKEGNSIVIQATMVRLLLLRRSWTGHERLFNHMTSVIIDWNCSNFKLQIELGDHR